MTDKYEINDLLSAAIDQKPSEFETAFGSLMLDRLSVAVANRKQEIARQMYGNASSEDEANPEEVE